MPKAQRGHIKDKKKTVLNVLLSQYDAILRLILLIDSLSLGPWIIQA